MSDILDSASAWLSTPVDDLTYYATKIIIEKLYDEVKSLRAEVEDLCHELASTD